MALAQQVVHYISVEEYLANEEIGEIRHEYVAGQVFAMAGANEAHNVIVINLASWLRPKLRGSQCRVFSSDMKVRIDVADTVYYPDVFVTCEPFAAKSVYKKHPCLIFEVLSSSTELIDRREKLVNYFKLYTLSEYVMISSDQMRVEIYRRKEDGKLELEILGPEDDLRLDSIPSGSLKITIAEIYEDVRFD
jgi:Uma2 family endonuclease